MSEKQPPDGYQMTVAYVYTTGETTTKYVKGTDLELLLKEVPPQYEHGPVIYRILVDIIFLEKDNARTQGLEQSGPSDPIC
jgi:hypothetical protein